MIIFISTFMFFSSTNIVFAEETNKGVSSLLDFMIKLTNLVWASMAGALSADSTYNLGIGNFEKAINNYGYIFRLFAYSLVVLLFGINVIENTIKYELFTIKGGVSVLGRLLFAKVWIDLSTTICLAIIKLTTGLASNLITSGTIKLLNPPTSLATEVSNVPVVGILIDLILGIIMLIPFILVLLVVGLSGIGVMIKITLRSLELTMLLIVAPMFFACLVADATKEFFKKFITTFISVSMHFVYMSIVYVVGVEWLNQLSSAEENDVYKWLIGSLPSLIILISISIMMIKPPKSLTNIIS